MFIKFGNRFVTDKGQILFPGPPIRVAAGDPITDLSIGDTDNEILGGSSWNAYSETRIVQDLPETDTGGSLHNDIQQFLEGFPAIFIEKKLKMKAENVLL